MADLGLPPVEDLEPRRSVSGPRRRSSGRRTNLALAVLLPLAAFTGALSFAVGVDLQVDPAAVHAVLALAVAILTPWKSAIVRRGLRRRRPSRYISAALGTLVAVALTSGVVQAAGWTDRVGPLTLMQIHVGSGIGAVVMVWLHYRSHPVRFRRIDFDRRSFLRSAGLAGLAAVVWGAWETTVRAAGWPGGERRFTGSHERGSHDPRRMPVTSWFNDRTPRIPGSEWRLRTGGVELGLSNLDLFPPGASHRHPGLHRRLVFRTGVGGRPPRPADRARRGAERSGTVGDRIPASFSRHRPLPPVARHPPGRSASQPGSRVPRPPDRSRSPGLLVGQVGGGG